MVQQRNEVTQLKDPTRTHIIDSDCLKLRSVPADMNLGECIDQSNDNHESFEPSYSDREHDVLSTYLHQIGKIPRLTHAEEIRLFARIGKYRKRIDECYQELAVYLPEIDPKTPPSPAIVAQKIGANSFLCNTEKYLTNLVQHLEVLRSEIRAITNRIVEANLRLAVCVAKKYQKRGLDLLDLIQEANIGLINAVNHFDWQRGVTFGSYASWWIQQAIGYGIANQGRTIRLPAYLLDAIGKANRAEAHFHQNGNYQPTPEQIAEASGLEVRKVMQLDLLPVDTTSLETCISQEAGGEIGDLIACRDTHSPLMQITQQNLVEEIKTALEALPPREKRIVSLRYGLEDGEEHSLQEIGAMLNLSRERIRQLEARALDRLRCPAQSERLRDFLVA